MELEERTYLPETVDCLLYYGFSRDFWNDHTDHKSQKKCSLRKEDLFLVNPNSSRGSGVRSSKWCLANTASHLPTSEWAPPGWLSS